MDVGAILSKSFTLYKRNLNLILPHLIVLVIDVLLFVAFALFTGLILLLIMGSLTITGLMSLLEGPTPFLFIGYLIFGLIVIFTFTVLLTTFARAAVIGMVIEAKEKGKTSLKTGLESAKKHGFRIFGYVIAIYVVPGLVMILVGLVMMAVAIFLLPSSAEMSMAAELIIAALFLFIALLFIIAYVIIYVIAMFTPQKIVIENLGVIDGIKASYGFVRRNITEVVIYIGFAFAVMVVTSLISMFFSIPRIFFTQEYQFMFMFLLILENLVTLILSYLITPFLEAVKTLMVLEEVESPPVVSS
jgi:hypothetical protein